jgi:DNA-binding transcriptional ArsR family regulator
LFNIESACDRRYLVGMRLLPHPERENIALPTVLDALSDPIRLAIVAHLAAIGETPCGGFTDLGSKPNLTYHLGRLREAGVVNTRVAGTSRFITLRREDLDARFPGLLDAILAASGHHLSSPARAEVV